MTTKLTSETTATVRDMLERELNRLTVSHSRAAEEERNHRMAHDASASYLSQVAELLLAVTEALKELDT